MKRHISLALLVLLAVVPIKRLPTPRAGGEDLPAMGMHTLRADDGLLQVAHASGATWLIQLLEWREVEPVPEEYFWEYTDWLVRAAEYYGLELVLRLDHPPDWAVRSEAALAVDVARYAAFAGRVAARYQGRVAAYVIWNEPNLAVEWGGRSPDPAGYVELLCAARAAISASDSTALIVSAGLAPTNHTTPSALDDRLYLQAMFDTGAAACFDVLGAHPYGFAYPPDDPHGAHDGLNLARLADLRAIMIEKGASDKPVWATELGWTTAAVDPEQQWLQVGDEEQALYLVEAFQKAAREWPWMRRIAIWNLSSGLAASDEKRGYSILADDGSPGPAYDALAALANNQGSDSPRQQAITTAGAQRVEILAPDVIVRLSDVDTFYPHWARPQCGSVPCRHWLGQFYVAGLPGGVPWRIHMEILQVEEPGNLVRINGHLLDPPAIPLRGRPDFASVWTSVEMEVPGAYLQPGLNAVEISSSPRLPVYQDNHARFESLQVRNVRLVTGF